LQWDILGERLAGEPIGVGEGDHELASFWKRLPLL
jgi:hypothetical protein